MIPLKKIFFNTFLLLLFPFLSYANPIFDAQGEYIITCYDTGKGGIEPAAEGIYPLIYNPNATVTTDKAFWIIKEESQGKYSFKNSLTNQYIKYAPQMTAEKCMEMTDHLDGDYTLFTLSPKEKDGKIYYAIVTVPDSDQYFNRRQSYNAVGTYRGTHSNNELFYFRERNELFEVSPGALFNYVNTFTLNEKELISSKDGLYYFSISNDKGNDFDVTLTISFDIKKPEYQIKINGKEVVMGQEFVFENATVATGHKIDIWQEDKIIASEKLIFTSLPIVQLYSEGNFLSSNFSKGKICVNEGSKTSTQTGELLHSEMRYRGATALGYSKKSFAIKLKDENGQSLDRSFFNLRNDNYWILDAMAVDRSRMRNRVCTDLWNDFSSDPHYKSEEKNMINGTRGHYVEVFLDDEYWGLYCMTERIDRKQLKLKKYQEDTQSIRGLLYKSTSWTYSTMMGYAPDFGPNVYYNIPDFNNSKDSWEGYEVKYPDFENGESIEWQPLYDVVDFTGKSSTSDFKNNVEYYFDIPVWADYFLFIELIMATDNHGKNGYFSIYDITQDSRLLITPWDLDGTFGRQWSGREIQPQLDFVEYIVSREHGEHNLFRRLKNGNIAGFNDRLKARYDKLRFTWFSEENLIARFEDYMEMFNKSGAATREKDRWGSLNLTQEMDYINEWIRDRVSYLNEQYGDPVIEPGPDPTGVDDKNVSLTVFPNPVKDYLYLENVSPGAKVYIYTEMGSCIYIRETESTSITINFSEFNSGRYFLKVGGEGKVIIKNP